ncbi:hypothetical protein [Cellulophaga sp. BC115SP]|uniref:hypothetical protein n=1 Tax=Cellulophaga sp. BC115SP TaxID=2683263 RepID=UPI0014134FAF|nr:hypothetical protein [Cellulophaga sp. BC115SP]NBB31918.1 hypothetical protein [Cellulophaga sp. BC115SP]
MIRIGVVSKVKEIELDQLRKIVAAINKQLSLHFAPYWAIEAQATIFSSSSLIPTSYFPVTIEYDIGEDLGGFHGVDDDGVPFGKVRYSSKVSYVLSHEILEMVHNPYLKKFRKTTGFKENEDDPLYVEEVADATDGKGYLIDGIEVSNFITPDWFNKVHVENIKYDFLGLLKRPRELYEGGYISWLSVQGEYWQAVKTKGKLIIRKLTGSSVASETKDNPWVYFFTFLGLCVIFLIYRIFNTKSI